jgi:large subunit ribosomal protein L9
MKVIFLDTNEVKDVAAGYARNYLFPRGLAILATEQNLARIEKQKESKEKKRAIQIKKAEEQKKELEKKTFEIQAKAGKEGKLHGSVTAYKIAKVVGVKKESVLLEKPIKELGEYGVEIKVDSQKAKIRLKVSEVSKVPKRAKK